MSAPARTSVEVPMPRLSDAMEAATVLAWLKAPGEAISEGDPLVEIETDKATMVYEAELDGILDELLVPAGEEAALGAPIARVLVDGNAALDGPTAMPPSPPADASKPPTRPRATPVARRVAADLGVDLMELSGSGPSGRIVRADVLAAPPSAALPVSRPKVPPGEERVELSALQRTIARRMVSSRTEIPEFTLNREVDVTGAVAMRAQLLDAGIRVSVNDLVVKAAALALRKQPALNSSWADDHIVRHGGVHIGIAVAADGALFVPVLPDADRKSLLEIAAQARALGKRARDRNAKPDELTGATFTVTNLGMLGIDGFNAVIDPPQVAILAVGAISRRPRFVAGDRVEARELMQLCLSCDHRVVYGADGARFLQHLAELLERPTLLLLPPGAADQGDEN
jgi:pyruvate dehydrogenase E2 component (dihydrolipoamide acetyltransferase)